MSEVPSLDEEMQKYGFDPTDEADVEFFRATDPNGDEPVTDYSKDSFEFGGEPLSGSGQ